MRGLGSGVRASVDNRPVMPTPSSRCFALVPCAGVGARAEGAGQTQYQRVAGRPMVAHTLTALAAVARIEATLVVLAPLDDAFERAVPGVVGATCWLARCGGPTRAESVSNDLHALAERGAHPGDWVLVHDAARCLIRPEWVDALIDACRRDTVGGLLALPLADTLKAEQGGRSCATVDRRAKWLAQTPQMFRLGALRDALAHAGAAVTDEASAMEMAGHAPKLVMGSLENFKVTYPADFALAERLLKGR